MRTPIAAPRRGSGARSKSGTASGVSRVPKARPGPIDVRFERRWHWAVNGDYRDMCGTLPLRLTNPLNGSHGHWAARARERKHQRSIVGLACAASFAEYRTGLAKGYLARVVVIIERIAPRQFDYDGLVASAKSVRDGIADALGLRDDNDERVVWQYAQSRGKPREYSVRITVRGET